MTHILERFVIHVASSAFITLAVYWALNYWRSRNRKAAIWLPAGLEPLLLVSGLAVFALLPLREPYDIVAGNQVWYKAITDQISWLLGAGLSVWGLYRFKRR